MWEEEGGCRDKLDRIIAATRINRFAGFVWVWMTIMQNIQLPRQP